MNRLILLVVGVRQEHRRQLVERDFSIRFGIGDRLGLGDRNQVSLSGLPCFSVPNIEAPNSSLVHMSNPPSVTPTARPSLLQSGLTLRTLRRSRPISESTPPSSQAAT